MLDAFDNNLPRRLRFGRGVSGELLAELTRLGCSRPFFVTDGGVAKAGILGRVTAPLAAAGTPVAAFERTEPEPPFSCVTDAVALIRATGRVDCIVALGGGSVIDTAKLVAATALDGRDAQALAGIGKVGRRSLPLICIPTTSGTGSEATPVAIFTNPETGMKMGVVDPSLVPDTVLLDPALTDGLPALPTAAAGMDALVHALEAYIAKVATPIARGMAIEAARWIGPALPAVCLDGQNRAARDAMLLGANLAGLAFANSSCCGVHALALPLGGRFHIAHGVVTGTLVAETMRHNLPACSDDIRTFASVLGWRDTTPEAFPDQLAALAESIGLKKALRAVEVPDSALAELAKGAVANRRLMDPNPRPITEEDAIAIYRKTLR
ncbi:MAG TPA: iron-containing alcohol dehydrogenase [Opitutaceae bacterium]|jgi:alcohol dehydrogenase class IV|nr:iron-containing alcohol dehydrogenase [Opitutaceae bacterium]